MGSFDHDSSKEKQEDEGRACSRRGLLKGSAAFVVGGVVGAAAGTLASCSPAPAPRMRDYVGALRAIFECWQTGGKLDYRSESYTIDRMQPFFNPGPIDCPEIPIALGAIGPRMTKVAGEVADVVIAHPTNSSPAYLADVMRPKLAEGARSAGRDASRLRLIANPMTLSADGDYLYLGTNGSGVFRRELGTAEPCPDLNGDGTVDIVDIMLVAIHWGMTSADGLASHAIGWDPRYDLDDDGAVAGLPDDPDGDKND